MHLFVFTSNPTLKNYLDLQNSSRRTTDSGFDIPMVEQLRTPAKQHTLDFEMIVAATDDNGNPEPLLLLPRSSIAATPFRLSNSIGLIDMGYRGTLKAKVDILDMSECVHIKEGTRYFQICRQNFMPWGSVTIVDDELQLPTPPDSRGAGGYGSTGH
jgi:dUTP pyrophosphatase